MSSQIKQLDILSDPIRPLVLRIAIPASTGFFFNTMYNVVDTYFAGLVSDNALAGMSMSFPIFIAMLAVALGISTGAGTLIANSLGAKDTKDSIQTHAQALMLCVVAALLLIAIFMPFLPQIYRLFSAEEEVLVHALDYSQILLGGGTVFFALNFTLNAGLNARGLTKIYRNLLIISFFANVGLDPLLMYGWRVGSVQIIPEMGIRGIALATVLVQIFGSLYLLYNVIVRGGLSKCTRSYFIPQLKKMKQIIALGLPAAIDMLMISVGAVIIVSAIGKFGTAPIAAYGIALRIEQIALIPTIGLTIALSSITGQSNGAGNFNRIGEVYRTCRLFGFFVFVSMMSLLLIFHRPIITIFTSDPIIFNYARSYLFTQAITFYAYILLFQSRSVLEGIKRPGIIAWIGISRQVIVPFFMFPVLSRTFGMGVLGIWIGIVIINWIAALVLMLVTNARLKKKIIEETAPSTPVSDAESKIRSESEAFAESQTSL